MESEELCGNDNDAIDDEVISIPENIFYNTSIATVVLPESCTNIGASAFRYCSLLASVTLSSAMNVFNPYVFDSCVGLTTINIPSAVTFFGDFLKCYSLIFTDVFMMKLQFPVGNPSRSFPEYYLAPDVQNYSGPTFDFKYLGYNSFMHMTCDKGWFLSYCNLKGFIQNRLRTRRLH